MAAARNKCSMTWLAKRGSTWEKCRPSLSVTAEWQWRRSRTTRGALQEKFCWQVPNQWQWRHSSLYNTRSLWCYVPVPWESYTALGLKMSIKFYFINFAMRLCHDFQPLFARDHFAWARLESQGGRRTLGRLTAPLVHGRRSNFYMTRLWGLIYQLHDNDMVFRLKRQRANISNLVMVELHFCHYLSKKTTSSEVLSWK